MLCFAISVLCSNLRRGNGVMCFLACNFGCTLFCFYGKNSKGGGPRHHNYLHDSTQYEGVKLSMEKNTLFEKVEITDPEYAQKLYEKETQKFKIKVICAGVSLLTSISWLLYFLLESVLPTAIEDLLLIPLGIGIIAAIISGPITIIKTIFKVGKIGYTIMPIILLDIFCFIMGILVALVALVYVPILHCAVILYQSYKAKKAAEEFLALDTVMSKGNHTDWNN